jgi:hypothetical protein
MAKKKRVLLKKLAKHNTMWHPDSRLVFKSKKDKLVIGRLDDQNELLSADELTLELCEQWNFKMDPSLVEDDDSETEEGASDASVDETAPAPETVDADAAPAPETVDADAAAALASAPETVDTAAAPETVEASVTPKHETQCNAPAEIDGEGLELLRNVGNFIVKLENHLRIAHEDLRKKEEELRKKDGELKKLREKHDVIRQLFSCS